MKEFSVLMSVYYKEKPDNLDISLKSIWDRQTLKPSQIVLVKDGALTPSLDDVIDKWIIKLGETIKIVNLERNVGFSLALNIGLKYCNFNIVARMDTDDISLPLRFERQINYLILNQHIDILGAFAQEIDLESKIGPIRRMPIEHEDIVRNLYANPLIHPLVVYRKDKILSIGGYAAFQKQDYELWFRCAYFGMIFHNLPEILLYYRFSKNTFKKYEMNIMFMQGLIGYRGVKSLKQSYWKAFFCFFPFLRSLLPIYLQNIIYKFQQGIDPRSKK